jgi:thiosulfate/3-mercaptopyruvate sulfurtransferase
MPRPSRRPILTAAELSARLAEPRLRLADVRWFLGDPARGQREYATGHIPGAVFVDLDRDLAAPFGPGRHPLPDPIGFADRMGQLGFGDEHAIVVYDDANGMVASRLWWMLDRLGHHDVALLDGGLGAWRADGGELTQLVPTPLRASLTLAAAWTNTLDRHAVAARSAHIDLVDLRAAERYRGEIEPIDPVPGHIPGARNLPATTLLDGTGSLLQPEQLRALLTGDGQHSPRPLVLSCGSGVTACFGALAARVAGLTDPLVYPGSYSDWSGAGMPLARDPVSDADEG